MKSVLASIGVVLVVLMASSIAQEVKKAAPARPPAAKGEVKANAVTTAKPAVPATTHADDQKAIIGLVEAFRKAFDAGDANAAAATYAEDALVIDEDEQRTVGRAAIRDQLAASFADNPGCTIAIKTDEVRFLGPDTALEQGHATVTPAGGGAPEVSRFTVIYIKKGGKWLQSVVRDEISKEMEMTPHDHLKALEWMVGDWVNESEDATVSTSCKWSADGNFLLRDFTMKTRGENVLSGTQRIGWDPVRQQFKAWIFDSEGGFGEGYWARNGDQWTIRIDGVRQDGKHVSATTVITKLTDDRATWQMVDRALGGDALPGVDEFTIVRKPPTPADEAKK